VRTIAKSPCAGRGTRLMYKWDNIVWRHPGDCISVSRCGRAFWAAGKKNNIVDLWKIADILLVRGPAGGKGAKAL
jgi:hypothetical protein